MRPSDTQFLTLLREEQGKLLRIARSITGQDADAWDMVQEATVAAYDHFAELRGGPESFGPWIRRILVNRCRNLLRLQSRMVLLEPLGGSDPGPAPEEHVSRSELWREVMMLDGHHRQVLVLRFLVDMAVDEIAAVLAVPPGTVKSRIHRALGALRRRLGTGAERGAAEK